MPASLFTVADTLRLQSARSLIAHIASDLHLFIQATVRHVSGTDLHGSHVVMYTAIGNVKLDGNVVSFVESVAGAFADAGFEVASERRRLLGAVAVIGFFNSIPSFEGWDATYDVPPKMPLTYHAVGIYLYDCHVGSANMCKAHGVPATHMETASGVAAMDMTRAERLSTHSGLGARVDFEMWSDEASGMYRETFNNLANLPGWTLDRMTSAVAGSGYQDSAQTWTATGERYFCSTAVAPPALTFDTSKWSASYRGEKLMHGTPALHFVAKHKETGNMSVEFFTTVPQNITAVEAVVHPIEFRVNYSDADGTPASLMRTTIRFTTFEPRESIGSSVFSWGLSQPFTNATACPDTYAYTDNTAGPSKIEQEAMIGGANPFTKFYGAPDATELITRLAETPTMLAAEYVATRSNVSFDFAAKEAAALASKRLTRDDYEAKQTATQGRLDYFMARDVTRRRKLEQRELGHDASCRLAGNVAGHCPDSCSLSSDDFLGELADVLPCSFEFSLPHMCGFEVTCASSLDVQIAPGLKLGMFGSLFMDCTETYSQCSVGGCVGLELSIGFSWLPWDIDFASLTACISEYPVYFADSTTRGTCDNYRMTEQILAITPSY